ncbi:hypothetical protein KDA_64020 [Dictyobacter alpinus]|uniref:Metallo-beta-lactamase domain-containing protein n=1 Tax=Dictyobacter alpinus TaxID=2014873 RepID=A0A402BHM3_9CHLR|nr:MBL fold metallo-hydrolase [Dictyobacter alpinus]GCE30918.1 hypothetical protein KDA_64020 [Dictyobacter alpinus]
MSYSLSSFNSPYFQLEQVADGIYAALAKGGAGAWGNAGIVDLGGQTLVFDTFNTPQAALGLRTVAEQLTGRKVTYVINSHHHSDHIWGNQAFEDATIYATDNTFDLMRTKGVARLERMRSQPIPLQSLEAALELEQDPEQRKDLELYINEMRQVTMALPNLTLRLPDVTFEHRLAFAGSKRTAVLLTFGGGHSPSDAFLYFPEESLAFMSDIVQIGFHPAMGDGNPDEWLRILARIEALQLTTIVPGHGLIGTGQAVGVMGQYIQLLQQMAYAAPSLDELLAVEPPAFCASWQARPVFKENLQFLYNLTHNL